jgi:hypothetical protein
MSDTTDASDEEHARDVLEALNAEDVIKAPGRPAEEAEEESPANDTAVQPPPG